MAKKEGIRKLFDNIAPDYDKLNHILSLNIDKGWRKKAVPLIYLTLHVNTWYRLRQSAGSAINPLLGRTAMNLLIFSLLFAYICLMN